MIAVRHCAADDAPAVEGIIRTLPEFFTADVPTKVRSDLSIHDAWVVTESGAVTGFIVVARKSPGGAEILWIAVDAACRGRGHGTTLLRYALDQLVAAGVCLVQVKTLDRSAGYRPYEATRAFYERNGFVYLDTIDPQPGWPPGNPAAIYVAALSATR